MDKEIWKTLRSLNGVGLVYPSYWFPLALNTTQTATSFWLFVSNVYVNVCYLEIPNHLQIVMEIKAFEKCCQKIVFGT
ncbi:unnamed protein product, partial [Vitis vinifera]|uniref:Uncharacterized protein n=1 Tax=Vitis vinifera TaxID=29760 RepID=E0CUQ6_VITVI